MSTTSYDTPAYIDFYLAELTVSESTTEVELVVHRTGEFRQTFQLDYLTVEDTATEGRDYKSTGGTLVFEPMETFKTITVGIIRDEQTEGVETFTVELSSTEPSAFIVRDSATVLIDDAPPGPPELQIRPGTAGSIILSWAAGTDCVLERAPGINAAEWETVPAEPVLNGERHEVQESVSNSLYIYRLRQAQTAD